ncbi:MAG: hypothetical protein ABWY82_20785 [Tardiphaga sp.]
MNLTISGPADIHAFLHPASTYQTPDDVLRDPDLSAAEKRVVLSSWASDANVVEAQPWLRQIAGADHPVRLADILAALRRLDGDQPPPKGGMAIRLRDLARVKPPVDCLAAYRTAAARRSQARRLRALRPRCNDPSESARPPGGESRSVRAAAHAFSA